MVLNPGSDCTITATATETAETAEATKASTIALDELSILLRQ
jgi:hypothetical protein